MDHQPSATCFVSDAPKISGSKEFTFAQGDTAVLSCKAECIPEPTEIIWRKGGDGDVISTAVNSRFVWLHLKENWYPTVLF